MLPRRVNTNTVNNRKDLLVDVPEFLQNSEPGFFAPKLKPNQLADYSKIDWELQYTPGNDLTKLHIKINDVIYTSNHSVLSRNLQPIAQYFVLEWSGNVPSKSCLMRMENYSASIILPRLVVRSFPYSQDQHRIMADEAFGVMKIILRYNPIPRLDDLCDRYNNEFITEIPNTRNTMTVSEFKRLLKEYDVDKSVIAIVPDVIYEHTTLGALQEPMAPIGTFDIDGCLVMTAGQAMFYTFQSLVCGVNWSKGEKKVLDALKFRVLVILETYSKFEEGLMITKSHVDALIENCRRTELANLTQTRDHLHEGLPTTEVIPVEKFYEIFTNLGLPRQEIYNPAVTLTNVEQARGLYIWGVIRRFFEPEHEEMVFMLIDELAFKMPLKEREKKIRMMKTKIEKDFEEKRREVVDMDLVVYDFVNGEIMDGKSYTDSIKRSLLPVNYRGQQKPMNLGSGQVKQLLHKPRIYAPDQVKTVQPVHPTETWIKKSAEPSKIPPNPFNAILASGKGSSSRSQVKTVQPVRKEGAPMEAQVRTEQPVQKQVKSPQSEVKPEQLVQRSSPSVPNQVKLEQPVQKQGTSIQYQIKSEQPTQKLNSSGPNQVQTEQLNRTPLNLTPIQTKIEQPAQRLGTTSQCHVKTAQTSNSAAPSQFKTEQPTRTPVSLTPCPSKTEQPPQNTKNLAHYAPELDALSGCFDSTMREMRKEVTAPKPLPNSQKPTQFHITLRNTRPKCSKHSQNGSKNYSVPSKPSTSEPKPCENCTKNAIDKIKAQDQMKMAENRAEKYEEKAKKTERLEKNNKSVKNEMEKMRKEMEEMKMEMEKGKKREEKLEMEKKTLEEDVKNLEDKLNDEQQKISDSQYENATLRRRIDGIHLKFATKLSELTKEPSKGKENRITLSSDPSILAKTVPEVWSPRWHLNKWRKMKDDFERDTVLEESEEMIQKMISDVKDEQLLSFCEYELIKFQGIKKIYWEVLLMNIEKIKKTDDFSDLFPLPEYPSLSKKFSEEYTKQMAKPKAPKTGLDPETHCYICFVEYLNGEKKDYCRVCEKPVHVKCGEFWKKAQKEMMVKDAACGYCRQKMDEEKMEKLKK